MTCHGNGLSTAVDCGLAVINGKQVAGVCVETNNGKAYCRMPAPPRPSPCQDHTEGKYCLSTQAIMTCHGNGLSTAVDCGLAVTNGKQVFGQCVETNDGKAYCHMPSN